jgi:uncharacterized short protein YbdD (DUF466 family)
LKRSLNIIGILFFIIIVGIYYYSQLPKSRPTISYEEIKKKRDSYIKKNPESLEIHNSPTTIKVSSETESVPQNKVYETKDEKFERFDQMEKEWDVIAKKLFGPSEYLEYVDMKEKNEKEKMEAYEAYHDYLRKKYGNNFKYNLSEDQSIREKSINDKYLNSLRKIIGDKKYIIYLKAKDDFNRNLIRKSGSQSTINIEF